MDYEEVEWGVMDVIDLVYERDRWRLLVNAVINI